MIHTHPIINEIKPLSHDNNPARMQYFLFQCRTIQPFRVSFGKSKWLWYNNFDEKIRIREILDNEIVIEFDNYDKDKAWDGIEKTSFNLFRKGYTFEIWDHGGKSPHLHIRNLPIAHLPKHTLREFKKFFIRKFVPNEFHDGVDYSLCGIHMIRCEYAPCWKGKYGIKKLYGKFEPHNTICESRRKL